MEREYELESDCELLWCRIQIKGKKTLHVGAYYRPHEGDEQSLHAFESSLSRIGDCDEHIVIGGDFNLPAWDWLEGILKPNCRYISLHYMFRDIIENKGLTQIVTEPTRGVNTLDLFLTNMPTKVMKLM